VLRLTDLRLLLITRLTNCVGILARLGIDAAELTRSRCPRSSDARKASALFFVYSIDLAVAHEAHF